MQFTAGKKFTEIVRAGSNEDIVLIKGQSEFGDNIWHYVLTQRIKTPILLGACKNGDSINLENYGAILKSGWGAEPARYIADKILKEAAKYDDSEFDMPQGQEDMRFFVTGSDDSGKEFYTYAIIPANRAREFEVVMPYGGCDINDYGIVVETDFGTPSEELKQRMREEGFKHPEDEALNT
jgi:hypothetical protein